MPSSAKEIKGPKQGTERVLASHSTSKGIASCSGSPSDIRLTSAGRPHDVQRTQDAAQGKQDPDAGVSAPLFLW